MCFPKLAVLHLPVSVKKEEGQSLDNYVDVAQLVLSDSRSGEANAASRRRAGQMEDGGWRSEATKRDNRV
jgi:hypothetical protein